MTSERRTIPVTLDQLLAHDLRLAERDPVLAETLRGIAAGELPADEAEAERMVALDRLAKGRRVDVEMFPSSENAHATHFILLTPTGVVEGELSGDRAPGAANGVEIAPREPVNHRCLKEQPRMTISEQEIQQRTTYHPPSPEGVERHRQLSMAAASFMAVVSEVCPEGREKALALTNIEQAKMWASAAVARNPETV